MSTTPNMGLTAWPLTTDNFSHSALSGDWTLVDGHDHTSGKGVQIPAAGIANLGVTTAKIADLGVTEAKLADGSVSAAKLKAEAWTAYTPVIAGLTLGTGGTIVGRYRRSGRLITAQGCFVLGTGGDLTSSGFVDGRIIPLPFTMVTLGVGDQIVGHLLANDSSSTFYYHGLVRQEIDTAYALFQNADTRASWAPLTATNPFDWTTGDTLSWNVTYESAS